MSRYDHKIEPSLEGIEHLSKEMKADIISFIGEDIGWNVDREGIEDLVDTPETKIPTPKNFPLME